MKMGERLSVQSLNPILQWHAITLLFFIPSSLGRHVGRLSYVYIIAETDKRQTKALMGDDLSASEPTEIRWINM